MPENVSRITYETGNFEQMPIINLPFERIVIDLVGAFNPPSKEGHKYILTIAGYATSFPETIPMKNITYIDVAEAFMTVFARTGSPK